MDKKNPRGYWTVVFTKSGPQIIPISKDAALYWNASRLRDGKEPFAFTMGEARRIVREYAQQMIAEARQKMADAKAILYYAKLGTEEQFRKEAGKNSEGEQG